MPIRLLIALWAFSSVVSATTISGTVTRSDTNAPIAGVTVAAYDVRCSQFGRKAVIRVCGEAPRATTDAGGTYALDVGEEGTFHLRTINAAAFELVDEAYRNIPCPGFCGDGSGGLPVGDDVAVGADGVGEIHFELSPGGFIEGVVSTTIDGLDLDALQVVAARVSDGPDFGARVSLEDNGSYRIGPLPEGEWVVRTANAINIGLIDQAWPAMPIRGAQVMGAEGVDVIALETTSNINLTLAPGGEISALAVDATTGEPIPGLGLVFSGDTDFSASILVTDDAGFVTIDNLFPDAYAITTSGALALGYVDEVFDDIPCFDNGEPLPLRPTCDRLRSSGNRVAVDLASASTVILELTPFVQAPQELQFVVGGSNGDGQPAEASTFRAPRDVVAFGNSVLIADGPVVRQVTPDGIISTVAGSGVSANLRFLQPADIDDVPARLVGFRAPGSLAVTASSFLLLDSNTIFEVSDGQVSVFNQPPDFCGSIGVLITANIESMALSAENTILALDSSCNRITDPARGISIETEIGAGSRGLLIEDADHAIFADPTIHQVIRINLVSGERTIVAGNGNAGFSGDRGPAANAQLNAPSDLALDANGNLFIADRGNNRIRRVDAAGIIATVAGTGDATQGLSTLQRGDGLAALEAVLPAPDAVAIADDGALWIVGDGLLRRVDPASDIITTIAGDGPALETLACTGGPSTQLDEPRGVAIDSDDNIYFAETGSHTVRRINAISGLLETVAGTGIAGFFGDGGPADQAQLFRPDDIAISGRILFIADQGNARIRGIDLDTGVISTLAGRGAGPEPDGNGGRAIDATIAPDGLDASEDRLVFAEPSSGTWRVINLRTGTIDQLAQGSPGNAFRPAEVPRDAVFLANGRIALASDRGLATLAPSADTPETFPGFPGLERLATDDLGRLYLSESFASSINIFGQPARPRVLRIDLASGDARVLAGGGDQLAADIAAASAFIQPVGLAIDSRGDVITADAASVRLVRITTGQLSVPRFAGLGENAQLGASTAASGDLLVVGAPTLALADGSTGAVAVYRRNGCRIELEQRIQIPPGFSAQGFGRALALDGNRLVVGANGDTAAKGGLDAFQVGLFERLDEGWTFKQPFNHPEASDVQEFGASVAVEGDTVVVGAPGTDEDTGAVFRFDFNGATFENGGQFNGERPGTRFGTSLALTRDKFGVGGSGSPIDDAIEGSVTLFDRIGDNLDPAGTVNADEAGSEFGAAIAIDGTTLVVGAPGSNESGEDSGSVFAFDFGGSTIRPIGILTAGDSLGGDRFGQAVALDRDIAYVGAPGASAQDGGTGAIYGFDLRSFGASKGSPGVIQKVRPRRFQGGLGTALDVANGRVFAGAPGSGSGQGDAIALQIALNLSGLAGLWFDPLLDGEGYNVITTPTGTLVYFYGYDREGKRLWLVSDLFSDPIEFGTGLRIPLFEADGGTFAQPSPPPDALSAWGELVLRFDSATRAQFRLLGADGEKTSDAVKLVGVFGESAEFGGLWFDPTLDGEGYNVIVSEAGTLFYFYGYNRAGERLWLVSDVISDVLNPNVSQTVPMFEARGGTFDTPRPPSDSLVEWGTLNVRFSSCREGIFELSGSDGTKTSSAVKLVGLDREPCVDAR